MAMVFRVARTTLARSSQTWNGWEVGCLAVSIHAKSAMNMIGSLRPRTFLQVGRGLRDTVRMFSVAGCGVEVLRCAGGRHEPL